MKKSSKKKTPTPPTATPAPIEATPPPTPAPTPPAVTITVRPIGELATATPPPAKKVLLPVLSDMPEIGTFVRWYAEPDGATGVIHAVRPDGRCLVKWSSGGWPSRWCHHSSLLPVVDEPKAQ